MLGNDEEMTLIICNLSLGTGNETFRQHIVASLFFVFLTNLF